MATNRPKDVVDYMLTGRGDPNAANMETDPILRNLYTPAPEKDPNQEISEKFVKKEDSLPPLPQSSRSVEIGMKYQGAPDQNWGAVDVLSRKALKQSDLAAKKMQSAVEEFRARPKTELPTPDYESAYAGLKEEAPKYAEAANKNVESINRQVEQFGKLMNEYNAEEKSINDTYRNKVDPFERDLQDMINNPPEYQPIDQGRIWRNSDTFSKIALAISMIFAARSDAGLKNATDAINRVVDNDLNAQKQDNIYAKDRYQAKLTGTQNLVSYYQNKYKNEKDGLNAARVNALTSVMNQVSLMSQSLSNKQSIMNAQKAIAEIASNATKNAFDAALERKKAAEKEAADNLTAVKEGVGALETASKDIMTAAALKEQQITHKAEYELKKAEVMAKMKNDMPAVWSDKYATYVDRAIPAGENTKQKNQEAHKQLGIIREQFAVRKVIDDYFDRVGKVTAAGFANRFGTDQELIDDATIYLFPAVKAIMGNEKFSDADARQLVEPYLPSRMTPVKRLEERRNAITTNLGAKIGETYYIDSLGIRSAMMKEYQDQRAANKNIKRVE